VIAEPIALENVVVVAPSLERVKFFPVRFLERRIIPGSQRSMNELICRNNNNYKAITLFVSEKIQKEKWQWLEVELLVLNARFYLAVLTVRCTFL
jgi:hypothetical protein